MRDWLLAAVVVTTGQVAGVNQLSWTSYLFLLAICLVALMLWGWVFPRLEPRRALTLEAWMAAGSALAIALLVAMSLGPESPYVFFYALLIVYIATFVERANVRLALIALASGCALAPIVYDWDEALSTNYIPTIIVAVGVWLIAAALIALKRVSAINAELEARRLGYVDQLTGAANRHALNQYVDELAVTTVPFAVTIVRISGIEEINRTLGHFVGDETLRRVAGAMRDASLEVDQVGRLAGAEFAVVLPGADLPGAERWRSRFHERLEIVNSSVDEGARVSANAGCAASVDGSDKLSDLLVIAEADSEVLAERALAVHVVPASPVDRAQRLREQMGHQHEEEDRPGMASIDAPTRPVLSIPVAVLLGVAIALTGGASSVLLSVSILVVAYFATFGTRNETVLAAAAMLVSALAAVIANAPVTNTDQTRAFTVFVAIAVIADTVQRNSRKLAVSERRAAELSLLDPLTGLANRTAFERDLMMMMPRNATAQQSRELKIDGPPAVVALEISDYKFVRGRLGHAGADLLLLEIAEALRDALAGVGAVYRIGPDEYATIIRSHHTHHVDSVGARCAEALRALDGDGRYAEQGVVIECRVGGATWKDGITAADLAAEAVSRQTLGSRTRALQSVVG